MRVLAGVLLLNVLACDPMERDCPGGVVIQGTPEDYRAREGLMHADYSVAPVVECPYGMASIAVTGTGTRTIDWMDAHPLFDDVVAELQAEGVPIHGPGATAFECFDSSRRSRYLVFFQLEDWRGADRTVERLGQELAERELASTVGVEVGIPIACAQ